MSIPTPDNLLSERPQAPSPDTPPPRPPAAAWLLPSVVGGLGSATLMWVLWWITHMPGVNAPKRPVELALGLLLLVGCALTAAAAGRKNALPVGIGAGVVAAVVNLLLLGSRLAVQAPSTGAMSDSANQLAAGAGVALAGFVAVSALVGGLGGLIGRVFAAPTRSAPAGRARADDTVAWSARLGAVTAVMVLPLLVVGGSVTSTASGLAVPDAVTSYGAVSVLFPLSLMAEPRVYLEHTHRLFGTLVGLATLLQAVLLTITLRRRAGSLVAHAWVLLAMVCGQGLLGIVRVDRGAPGEGGDPGVTSAGAGFALVHGATAQAVFAVAVWLAARLAAACARDERLVPEQTGRTARLAARAGAVTLGLLAVQLLTGATSRHFGAVHAVWTHVIGSLFVATLVVVVASALRGGDAFSLAAQRLRGIGGWMVASVFAQMMLGLIAFAYVGQRDRGAGIPTAEGLAAADPIDPAVAAIATAHQSNGALLIALVTLGTYWAWRTAKLDPARVGRHDPSTAAPLPA